MSDGGSVVAAAFSPALVLWLSLAGCQQYHPMPMTEESVDLALTPPDADALRVSAASLHNPLLRPVALEPEQGLTPDQAAILAVLMNPSLRGLRDQNQIAESQLIQAGVLPNPTLSYTMDFPFGANSSGNVAAYGIGIDWELTSLIDRSARVRAADLEKVSVMLEVAWQEWQIAQAAKLAVVRLICVREQASLAEQVDQRLEENARLRSAALEQGNATILDASAAEAASREARAKLVELQRRATDARLALNKALGLPPETMVKLREGMTLPSRLDVPPADQRGGLEQCRLDLIALRRGYESQEETLRAAILRQFPKVSLGFSHTRDSGDFYTAGFGVTIELPIFDRNQGAIGEARATRQKLYDEYVNRVFEARADIAAAVANIDATNRQIAAAQAALLSLRKLADLYRAAADNGTADILSSYTALNDVTQTQIDIVSLQQQLMENWTALELSTGTYLPLPDSPGGEASLLSEQPSSPAGPGGSDDQEQP